MKDRPMHNLLLVGVANDLSPFENIQNAIKSMLGVPLARDEFLDQCLVARRPSYRKAAA